MKKMLCAVPMLALAAPAFATADDFTAGSYVDAYYSHLKIKMSDVGHTDGDGGGLRFWMGNGVGVFTAEAQTAKTNGDVQGVDLDIDVDDLRVGLGGRLINRPDAGVWARAEYIRAKADADASFGGVTGSASDTQEGYGLHFGGMFGRGPFRGYAEVGYLHLEDLRGGEYAVGVNVQPGLIGGFAEFRYTDLDVTHSDVSEHYSNIRVGVRVGF